MNQEKTDTKWTMIAICVIVLCVTFGAPFKTKMSPAPTCAPSEAR